MTISAYTYPTSDCSGGVYAPFFIQDGGCNRNWIIGLENVYIASTFNIIGAVTTAAPAPTSSVLKVNNIFAVMIMVIASIFM